MFMFNNCVFKLHTYKLDKPHDVKSTISGVEHQVKPQFEKRLN